MYQYPPHDRIFWEALTGVSTWNTDYKNNKNQSDKGDNTLHILLLSGILETRTVFVN